MSDAMAALLLLSNANVDSGQRLSILEAAAPKDEGLSPRSSLDDFVRSISYEKIATIIRQCDKPVFSVANRNHHGRSSHAMSASVPPGVRSNSTHTVQSSHPGTV